MTLRKPGASEGLVYARFLLPSLLNNYNFKITYFGIRCFD